MNFTDSQLQKCYESNLAEAADLSGELRQVRALIAVYDLFQMLEGPHSSRVHETVWRLLLPICMRRPKGIKTRKSVAKRFKITGTGKVMRRGAGRRHLLQGKSPKRRRRLRKAVLVGPTDVYRIKQNLPFSH